MKINNVMHSWKGIHGRTLCTLTRPLQLRKKLHAEVKPLHELDSHYPVREAAPKQKLGRLVEQTSHGANVSQ